MRFKVSGLWLWYRFVVKMVIHQYGNSCRIVLCRYFALPEVFPDMRPLLSLSHILETPNIDPVIAKHTGESHGSRGISEMSAIVKVSGFPTVSSWKIPVGSYFGQRYKNRLPEPGRNKPYSPYRPVSRRR